MDNSVILKISNLSKSFGPVAALRSVDLELRRGEVHAIAGENGAGKSTLMKIIDGILRPDSGEIFIDGKLVSISSPTEAQKLGIGFVHQEIALCPDISVAENIFMGVTNTSKALLMRYAELKARASTILKQLGDIDSSALVGVLSISQQQLVEIAKALTLDCRILIFDEPTAALTEREAKILFEIIHRLADKGIAIIYISHRMAEIFDNCDRVTVLRDGQHITTRDIKETTPEQVVAAMVGRIIDKLYPEKQRDDEKSREIILEVANLSEKTRFRDVSFQLAKGEILGLGGLIGAGRSEIVKGICRLEGDVTGAVALHGQLLSLVNYGDSIDAGIVYLSEDRKGDGLFLDMSIASNISALAVEQVASRLGLIDDAFETQRAEELGRRLTLKCGHVGQPVSALSGGNQQKVAIAKMLSVEPKVIFLDEPTRGVDVGAKAEIHRILRDLARAGVGVVVISSELPELIGICDRVLVVREGRITGEVTGEKMTEENIMYLASIADERPHAS
ncbi:MAG: ATP-binding cassette domain-containing protein [Mesorhizobium sp.]|uniref:sugar ABC transporter ATP-binding protein n=2 Tax=Mesorhizobium TaxID=68287 RepID=UPI000F75A35D|nr:MULTISPECIES: sugar ABC transporter ATP-binding protein [unclassified Mesorhizobium]TGV92941.1 sugar ABC transporter ATP-binding protein [Mesorhizobium sp. M00.F.Ca.ET.158.01.1.1]AZO61989.1 sugar ABC transporter ATP-binding protein [Mesorhizobium sp. M1A.F.Ca.IN.022.06.1.1]MCT2580730.1 sugar ABC transporter ATP-binding protein [Mesorhizobium sp. P13.3]MDF3169672.1 sugar ABC transporter ATP-binding protein [Mesorhizobium sp. P16.1]MDF3179476.1 sugar ABC transporter ATP-binding protein [Mesor